MATSGADLIRRIQEVNQDLVLGRAIYDPTIGAMSPESGGTEGRHVNDLAVSPTIALGPMFYAVTEVLARIRRLELCDPFAPLQHTLTLRKLGTLLINVPTNTHCRVADVLHWKKHKEHGVVRIYTNVRQQLGIVAEASMHFCFLNAELGGEEAWTWTRHEEATPESHPVHSTVIDRASVETWVKTIFPGSLPEMMEVALTRVPLALLFGRVLEACVRANCQGNPAAFRSLEMNMLKPAEQDHPLELHIHHVDSTKSIVTVIDPDFTNGGREVIATAAFTYDMAD